jgi:hypothetical protein
MVPIQQGSELAQAIELPYDWGHDMQIAPNVRASSHDALLYVVVE